MERIIGILVLLFNYLLESMDTRFEPVGSYVDRLMGSEIFPGVFKCQV